LSLGELFCHSEEFIVRVQHTVYLQKTLPKIPKPIPPSIFHPFFHPSSIFPVTKMSSEKTAFSKTDFQKNTSKNYKKVFRKRADSGINMRIRKKK
jgi:hypothetical protein